VPSGVRYRPAHCFGLVVDRAGAGLLPSQVELLAYERVGVQVDGRVIWRIDGQEVDPSSIWHVWAFTVPGQVLGLSPIDHARQAVGLGLGAERYAARFFGQSAIPSGVLTSDQDIKQERADQLKARWREAHAAQRDIAVLGSGAKFQAVTIPPEQAQFLETTRANVATIARYFSVQPELIGGESGGSLTYANVEQRALDFLTFGLRSWLVRLETALSGLLSSTTTVKFNAAAPGPHRPAHPLPGARERDPGRLETALRGPGAGGPPAHRRHRRPGRTGGRMIHNRYFTGTLAIRDNSDGRTLVGPLLPWGVPPAWSTRAASSPRPSPEERWRVTTRAGYPSPPPTHATPAPCPSASRWSWRTGPTPPGALGTSRTP
jgi:hypothetical protein